MFIDKAVVLVSAGKGGDGAVSFRHEKYVDKGGPDGGDGGDGADVIFCSEQGLNTLTHFRYKQVLAAEAGQPGSKRRRHGKKGADLLVKVPVGTVVRQDSTVLADFTAPDQRVVVAKGGVGGFGNAHFISSIRQAPRVAEKGEAGDEVELNLELKLLADVGLVGLPNAGKSTFLSVVTNAQPEIADYPFTTLTPHLGVAAVDNTTLLIADLPGLIEGAAEGKGLGQEFLRHVQRTSVLLHLIDVYGNDLAHDYKVIRAELAAYSADLTKRPEVVCLTKTEGLDEELLADLIQQLRTVVPRKTPIMAISSQAHRGLTELLRVVNKTVKAQKAKKSRKSAKKEPHLPVFQLSNDELAWRVRKTDGHTFWITGSKIEKFARRTDMSSFHGRQRLRDILKKMGIMHDLIRQGADQQTSLKFGRSTQIVKLYED